MKKEINWEEEKTQKRQCQAKKHLFAEMIMTLTIENENDLVPQSTALLHKKRVVLGVN